MIHNFLLAISFFTRIPVPHRNYSSIKLAQAAWAFPVAGAIIGMLDGIVYLMALGFNLSPDIAAWLTIIFHLILTGGLHEDGLADTADGLASGRDREQKLAIMRDSRIGSYGVLSLISVISLKAAILSDLSNSYHTILALMAAGAVSRSFITILMYKLPAARSDGLSYSAARPTGSQTLAAVIIGILTLLIASSLPVAVTAMATLFLIYFIMKKMILRNFGGITGDILGAGQQISEIVILIILGSAVKYASA